MSNKVDGLPEVVPIAHLLISVEPLPFDPERDPKTVGDWDRTEQCIRVKTDQSLDERRQTFFHEVVHIGLERGGLAEMFDDDQNEAICECMGYLLSGLVATGFLQWGPASRGEHDAGPAT